MNPENKTKTLKSLQKLLFNSGSEKIRQKFQMSSIMQKVFGGFNQKAVTFLTAHFIETSPSLITTIVPGTLC
jgi:hypothetical protein